MVFGSTVNQWNGIRIMLEQYENETWFLISIFEIMIPNIKIIFVEGIGK